MIRGRLQLTCHALRQFHWFTQKVLIGQQPTPLTRDSRWEVGELANSEESDSFVRFRGSVIGEVLRFVNGAVSFRNIIAFVADMQRPVNSVSKIWVNIMVAITQTQRKDVYKLNQ